MTLQDTTFFAQPYNTDATGFYFHSADEWLEKSTANRCQFGNPVEEYSIEFISADDKLVCELAQAAKISQSEIPAFYQAIDDWDEDQLIRAIIALADGLYSGSFTDFVDEFDVDDIQLYQVNSLQDLAAQFVDDGLFGNVSDRLSYYIDYDALARDLGFDGYTEAHVGGCDYVYYAN